MIVLAAQRRGMVDPLAARFGVSHKCLVPTMGRPLIGHVLDTLAGAEGVASVAISVESDAFAQVAAILPAQSNAGFELVAAADNIADSVVAAAEGHQGPLVVTTADNVLLSAESLAAMGNALLASDVAFAMARREAVLAAHPEGQRRFYRFRDGAFSNCNLYGIADRRALHAADIFRGGGQFAKEASRVVGAFGVVNLVLLRLGRLPLAGVARRISARIGLRVVPVVLTDGSQAIDVDNDRTFAVVEQLLRQRPGGHRG